VIRRNDWPERLAAFLRAEGSKPADAARACFYFVADAILAMTDVDPVPEREATIAAAYARMRRDGYETVRDAVAGRLTEVPLSFARRGDVVMRLFDGVECGGICVGERSAFLKIEGGLIYLPTLEQLAAFRVGE
jgi:hypothetical protein